MLIRFESHNTSFNLSYFKLTKKKKINLQHNLNHKKKSYFSNFSNFFFRFVRIKGELENNKKMIAPLMMKDVTEGRWILIAVKNPK